MTCRVGDGCTGLTGPGNRAHVSGHKGGHICAEQTGGGLIGGQKVTSASAGPAKLAGPVEEPRWLPPRPDWSRLQHIVL